MDIQNMNNKQKKVAVLAEMALGAKRQDMMAKYGVGSTSIINWRREELEKRERDATVESLAKVEAVPVAMAEIMLKDVEEPISVEDLTSNLKEKASANLSPKEFTKLDRQIDKMADGLTGLKMLETDFQVVMLNLLTWANNKIEDDMKISEWTQLVTGISTLHGTMFGKGAGTTINMMQQNNGGESSTAVSKFKSGFRS